MIKRALPSIFALIFPIASFCQDCQITNNFFESLGGRSSDQKVKGSDGCKTMVMDDGFEIITLTLGSIPDGSADFNIVNYDATPGDTDVAVKYYYYAGNTEETMEFSDSGKTAHLCKSDGKITVTWNDVGFKGSANGKIIYKTICEMTCVGLGN